jgi:hypothetical protein
MVLTAGPTNAVQEMIDLVDQRFQQRTRVFFNAGQQGPQRDRRRLAAINRETGNGLLAMAAALVENLGLVFDFPTEAEDSVSIAPEKAFLLLLEKIEERAILGEFLAK